MTESNTDPTLPVFPGYGLPLDFDPWPRPSWRNARPDPRGEGRRLFPTALDDSISDSCGECRMPMITARETAMLAFLNQVTDKEDWVNKVTQEYITEKWREEIKQQNNDFTDKMVDYCLEELKYKAEVYKKTGVVSLFHGDVVKSDAAIPNDLQAALKAAVVPLENVPDDKKDWHPGSDDMVLDLVHPSLYPLIYGLSRIITREKLDLAAGISSSGTGDIIPVPGQGETGCNYRIDRWDRNITAAFSRRYQWLPCDVDIAEDTPNYVNNLHPRHHSALYNALERIIGKIVPLWNATLTPLREFDFNRRIQYGELDYGDLEDALEKDGPRKEGSDDEDYDDYWDQRYEWMKANRPLFLVRPEPYDFEAPASPEDPVDLKKDYGHRGLQIIIKLANIHLTPEKPEYKGGSWHVEGKMISLTNEHICASAIYYYDNENITPSYLAFRQAVHTAEAEEQRYEQGDSIWLQEIYGMKNWSAAVQNAGSIETREGRVITFPNILQHQVQPFRLADPEKAGHRKILALFLVDPNVRVISTAHVPCQQKEWWADPMLRSDGPLSRLPAELRSLVIHNSKDFPISIDEAKEFRKELMEERKKYELASNGHFEEIEISLCEH
ncbi:hypothetical protein AN958_03373 [Leucoagaricus sp. SymC.cos]|nr:hypothetical protein AN958_03373 [Leucoagaricus sp. SymC.cos]